MSKLIINDERGVRYEGFVKFRKEFQIFRLNAVKGKAGFTDVAVYRNIYKKHGYNYEIVVLGCTIRPPETRFSLLSASRLVTKKHPISATGQDPETGRFMPWTCLVTI